MHLANAKSTSTVSSARTDPERFGQNAENHVFSVSWTRKNRPQQLQIKDADLYHLSTKSVF
jgi:hypothetical protein